jgi:hypothetical protein
MLSYLNDSKYGYALEIFIQYGNKGLNEKSDHECIEHFVMLITTA